MDKATPLINSSLLQQHRQETVQLVGKVEKNTGQTLMLQTSDLGTVEVTLSDSTYSGSLGQFVTVVGRVDDHGERVRGFRCIDLGDKLDLNLVEQCIQLQPRFPDLFGSPSD